ncbi:MAG: protease modulator HflC [Gammaproteobacteria bacterium]
MVAQRILLLLVVAALVAATSLFTVDERERAIVLRFGQIVGSGYGPGLHLKLPWPVNNVVKFDRRLLTLDSEPSRFLTSEKKEVIVDSFVRWKITDVEQYFRSTAGEQRRAEVLLFQKVNGALRNEFGKRTVQDVVSGERGMIMATVTTSVREQVRDLGIEVLDVRVSRIDFPEEVAVSVYPRMRAERERVARDFRSKGAESAERIRAAADREKAVILAEASRDAETVRGEGDAIAAEIYARAYSANAEFYAFYRSLGAYRSSFGGPSDVLVLKPDSEFFRYFGGTRSP